MDGGVEIYHEYTHYKEALTLWLELTRVRKVREDVQVLRNCKHEGMQHHNMCAHSVMKVVKHGPWRFGSVHACMDAMEYG